MPPRTCYQCDLYYSLPFSNPEDQVEGCGKAYWNSWGKMPAWQAAQEKAKDCLDFKDAKAAETAQPQPSPLDARTPRPS